MGTDDRGTDDGMREGRAASMGKLRMDVINWESPKVRERNGAMWARVAAELAARQAVLERVRELLWGPGCEHLPDLDRLALLDQQKALTAQVELLDGLLAMTEIATPAAVA